MKYKQLLFEANKLQELIDDPQVKKHIGVLDAINIWEFSPDWVKARDKGMDVCRIKIPFKTSSDVAAFRRKISEANSVLANQLTMVYLGGNGTASSFSYPVAKRYHGLVMQAMEKLFGTKVKGITFTTPPNSKSIMTVKSDDESILATAFVISRMAVHMEEYVDIMYGDYDVPINDPKDKPKTTKQWTDVMLKALSLTKPLDGADSLQEWSQKMNNNLIGEYNKSILRPNHSNSQTNSYQMLELIGSASNIVLAIEIAYGKTGDSLKQMLGNRLQFCSEDFSTPEMKWMISKSAAALEDGTFSSIDDLTNYLEQSKIALLFNKFQAKVADLKRSNDEIEKNNGDVSKIQPVPTIDSYDTIKSFVDAYEVKHIEDEEKNKEDPFPTADELTNNVARRRLKLFEDAKYYGAKILNRGNWLVAVCSTPEQCGVFSRNKPKVDENGQIIAYANMRDDEIDALDIPKDEKEMYKQIRDAAPTDDVRCKDANGNWTTKTFDFVNDHLGVRINEGGTSDVFAIEAIWCTGGGIRAQSRRISNARQYAAGVSETRSNIWGHCQKYGTPSFFHQYNKGLVEDRPFPYLDFMDKTTGRLYQYSRSYNSGYGISDNIANEGDRYNTITGGGGIDSAAVMVKNFKNDPEFASLVDVAYKGFGDMSSEELQKNAPMSKDGYILISSYKEAYKYQILFSEQNDITKIRVTTAEAYQMFSNINLQNILEIDMSLVTDAGIMFKGATLPTKLTLIGMKNVVTANSMFKEATNANIIEGIDMSSVEKADSMFYSVKTFHDLNLYLHGSFNMQKCKNIDYMFWFSPVTKIELFNTDQIESAIGYFRGCRRLTELPQLEFKQVSIDNIADKQLKDIKLNPFNLLLGCTGLMKNRKETLAKLTEIVNNAFTPYIKTIVKNGKTLITITDVNRKQHIASALRELNTHPDKYDGIIFDGPTSFKNVFYEACNTWGDLAHKISVRGSSKFPIFAEIIDFGTIVDADSIFDNMDITSVAEFWGTENIRYANDMFAGCEVDVVPKLNLINCEQCRRLFTGLKNVRTFPKLNVSHTLPDFSTPEKLGHYILGEAQLSEFNERLGEARTSNWLESILLQRAESLKEYAKSFVVDGVATLTKEHDAVLLCDLLKSGQQVQKIKFGTSNASGFLSNQTFTELPTIDFTGVKQINRLFEASKIYKFGEFLNLNGVTTAMALFKDANIDTATLPKFDMPQCVSVNSMFRATMLIGEKDSYFHPVINIPKCTDADEMFTWARWGSIYDLKLDITSINMPNVVTMKFTFASSTSNQSNNRVDIKSKDRIEFEKATNATNTFLHANLVNAKEIIFKNVCDCGKMLAYASSEKPIKKIQCGSQENPCVTSAYRMLYSSTIKMIGQLNIYGKKTSFEETFAYSKIESICMMDFGQYEPSRIYDAFYKSTLQEVYQDNVFISSLTKLKKALAQATQQMANESLEFDTWMAI